MPTNEEINELLSTYVNTAERELIAELFDMEVDDDELDTEG